VAEEGEEEEEEAPGWTLTRRRTLRTGFWGIDERPNEHPCDCWFRLHHLGVQVILQIVYVFLCLFTHLISINVKSQSKVFLWNQYRTSDSESRSLTKRDSSYRESRPCTTALPPAKAHPASSSVQSWSKVVATLTASSFTLRDERNDHPIQIIEERKQVKPELHKALLLMTRKSSEDLGCIIHVVLVAYLVDVVQDERQVEEERNPLSREEEQSSQDGMGDVFR